MWFHEPAEGDRSLPLQGSRPRSPSPSAMMRSPSWSSSASTRRSSPASASSRSSANRRQRRNPLTDAAAHEIVERIARGRSRSTAFVEARAVRRGRLLRAGRGARGAPGATSSPVPKSVGSSARCVGARSTGCWHELGEPDPFVVIEAGAGQRPPRRATCCAPARVRAALRYVLVETLAGAARRAARAACRSSRPTRRSVRSRRRDDEDAPVPGCPAGPGVHRARRPPRGGARRRRVRQRAARQPAVPGRGATRCRRGRRCGSRSTPAGEFTRGARARGSRRRRALGAITDLALPSSPGARLPIPRGIDGWFEACGAHAAARDVDRDRLRRRRAELLERGAPGLAAHVSRARTRGSAARRARRAGHHRRRRARATCRARGRAGRAARLSTSPQAEWLAGLGIEALVEAGRRMWEERAHIGDLDALAGRSRVAEAGALTDPAGLGASRRFVSVFAGLGSLRRRIRRR